MRTKVFMFTTALALAATSAARGQEAQPTAAPVATDPVPPEPTPPSPSIPPAAAEPRSLQPNFSLVATRPGQPEKGTYLGVSTSPAPPALQKQLQLKPGVGLVVDDVDAGSPAEKAGVKQFDILHKLDDQLVINAEQLGVLVRTYPAGKEVKLTVIREGKPQQLAATLAERELPQFHVLYDWFSAGGADAGAGVTNRTRVAALIPAATQNASLQARQILLTDGSLRATVAVPDGGTLLFRTPDGKDEFRAARLTIEDDRHKMTLSTRDGRKQLKVQDKSGKVLFDGPIQTREELEKIPSDLRQTYTELLLEYTKDVNAPAPTTNPK